MNKGFCPVMATAARDMVVKYKMIFAVVKGFNKMKLIINDHQLLMCTERQIEHILLITNTEIGGTGDAIVG